jgi:ribonuclease HIII
MLFLSMSHIGLPISGLLSDRTYHDDSPVLGHDPNLQGDLFGGIEVAPV